MNPLMDLPEGLTIVAVFSAILLTLVAHVSARMLAKRISGLPMVITALGLVIALLYIFNWDYDQYYAAAQPIFDRLLGYVTVMLAIPIASMSYQGLPLKKLTFIVIMASVIGALLPMGLSLALSLSHDTVLAFATRSVTTPIGLSIAKIIHSPLAMANLIIIVSGLIGVSTARTLLKNIHDDRAKGLGLGLAAHAFGTVEAWQISPTAGRYAAFGLAINGLITAVWVPIFLTFVLAK